jgi:hypothetical protein
MSPNILRSKRLLDRRLCDVMKTSTRSTQVEGIFAVMSIDKFYNFVENFGRKYHKHFFALETERENRIWMIVVRWRRGSCAVGY